MDGNTPKDKVKEISQETILCRVKYHNTLPDIAFDPKFLICPFESSRFVQYAPTSLERNHKHELLCEADVGVDVDLIDPDVFKTDRSSNLHRDDEKLLEDDDPNAINDRRSRHQRSVSWLRKTEYLSTEHYNKWNKAEKFETKLGHNIKQRFTEEIVYRDRESQINAIQATFEAAKKPIRNHYSKPGVHAIEVLPLLPDFKLWRYPCAQVIFDDDPARKGQSVVDQREEVNQAVIRGMVDETGDHFVVYFLPTEETKRLRRLDAENHTTFTEGASYEYEKAREYNWNVKNKTMVNYEENYFFVFRKDDADCQAGVYYNELETRVRLSKRRKLQSGFGGSTAVSQQPSSKMRLVVRHRGFTNEELQAQTARLDMLKHESADEGDGVDENQDEAESRRESSPDNSQPHSSSVSSPADSQKKPRELNSDDDLYSQEEEEEEKHRSGSTPHKRPMASDVFSDEDVEESEPEPADQKSMSSDLSNDSPPQSQPPSSHRHLSKRAHKDPSPDIANDSDQEDIDSPSPPPSHQRRKPQKQQRHVHRQEPARVSSSRHRPVASDSDELSSLSD